MGECGRALHGGLRCRLSCTRTRSAVFGKEGQGRPLGLLAAWIVYCPEHADTKLLHSRCWLPSLSEREAQRAILINMALTDAGMAALLEIESRQRRPDEPDEPPQDP